MNQVAPRILRPVRLVLIIIILEWEAVGDRRAVWGAYLFYWLKKNDFLALSCMKQQVIW